MKKFVCFWALTLLVVSALFASTVHLQWDASSSTNVTGYKIYSGGATRTYSTNYDVGNVLDFQMPLANTQTYYIAASAYLNDPIGGYDESDLSDELVYVNPNYTNPPTGGGTGGNGGGTTNPPPVNLTYVGAMLDYGTNLAFLSHQLVFIDSFSAPNFYRLSLVITNKPLIGTVPNDGNAYRYLVSKLDYGTNLASVQSEYTLLMTRTNAPGNELYRSSLVITNKPFGLIATTGPIITNGLVVYHAFSYGETNFVYDPPDYRTTEPFGSNDLTAVAWVRTTSFPGSQMVVGKSLETSGHQYYGLSVYNGRMSAAIQGAFGAPNGINPPVTINDGKWHHIAAVFSNTVLYAYVDGTNQGSAGAYPPPINIRGPLVMGQFGITNVTYPWLGNKGDIGSVSVYSRALTDDEIATLASPKKP